MSIDIDSRSVEHRAAELAMQSDFDTLRAGVQMAARKAELMSDKAWATRYLAGGVAEVREMTALNQMITGVA